MRKPSKARKLLFSLALFPVLSFFAGCNSGSGGTEPESDTVKARLAVGSDTHVDSYNSTTRLPAALESLYGLYPDLDAFVDVGDITNNGTESQYTTLMNIANSSSLAGKILWCMGNHEGHGSEAEARFKEYTGQDVDDVVKYGADANGNGGITVIKLAGSTEASSNNYTESYDFLKAALEKAAAEDPDAPIFVMAHAGIKDPAYVTDEWNGNYGEGTETDLKALMAQYPQVIHISGHSHSTVNDCRSIDQSAGFTCIQDGHLTSYFENESGKINASGSHSTYPDDPANGSQALIIEVSEKNIVTIRRYDVQNSRYIYGDEPWVIDIPDLVKSKSFTYTSARAADSKAPVFPDGSAVTATSIGTDSVTFSFSQASAADGLDTIVLGKSNVNMVHAYKIQVTATATGETIDDTAYSRAYWLRWSDFYLSPQASTLSTVISGLSAATEYKIEVWALTSYETESSNSISATFTTAS